MEKDIISKTSLKRNEILNRFELQLSDGIAFVEYEKRGNTYFLIHTEVAESMTGQGVASILVKKVLDLILIEKANIKYFCPYIELWMKRHPEYLEKIGS